MMPPRHCIAAVRHTRNPGEIGQGYKSDQLGEACGDVQCVQCEDVEQTGRQCHRQGIMQGDTKCFTSYRPSF